MIIGNKEFDFKNTAYIMGIINATPDSFSDGGKYKNGSDILKTVAEMIASGASIIDIGGESAKPGYIPITEEEEISRIVPYIELISNHFDIPISVDTYKSKVAKAALDAGAHMINDIWGLKADSDMAAVISKYKVPCCLMHNRDINMHPYSYCKDMETDEICLMKDIELDLLESIDIAISAGIAKNNIILDPGIGFAKSYEENLMVMKHLDKIADMGYPVLLGTSRKSMIGIALDAKVEDRLEGTLATTVYGRMKGCSIFRVHDVKENYKTLVMTEKLIGRKKEDTI